MATVVGQATNPGELGVLGTSIQFEGVTGISHAAGHGGVVGKNENQSDNAGPGVFGFSTGGEGVRGVSHSAGHGGVVGTNASSGAGVFGGSTTGVGVHGKGGRLAALFEGDVEVTGDIRLANADCAEDFDIIDADLVEPGTVMVVGEEGALHQSHQAYDKRVAGVISGAGACKPGIIFDKQHSQPNRKPIALLGKVYCKVDASQAPIEVGDLLTTAPTPGHAMKATDPLKAFGAVIGKALRPLREGRGLIPILVALQ